MVKPEHDVTKDYYSLLEVSIRADAEEIKKQYRKLGAQISFMFVTMLTGSIIIPSRQKQRTRRHGDRKVPAPPDST
jgi:hypothetical protein